MLWLNHGGSGRKRRIKVYNLTTYRGTIISLAYHCYQSLDSIRTPTILDRTTSSPPSLRRLRMFIAIIGSRFAGKSTIADYLVHQKGFIPVNLSDSNHRHEVIPLLILHMLHE